MSTANAGHFENIKTQLNVPKNYGIINTNNESLAAFLCVY